MDVYYLVNRDGSKTGGWKIAYKYLNGTYKDGKWVDFKEPRVLIEKPIKNGIDFREVPERFLTKQ